MDAERINQYGGINVSKLFAYSALNTSATDPWNFDIDRCIVIDDFEAPVTGRMKYIKPDYSYEIGTKTVTINHCDGVGMMLPCVSTKNFMVRGPWIKGLLSTFDYLRFCEVNHVEPKIKDIWGLEHDLIQENIQIIFTKSQMKMYKYYDSWQQYKDAFHRCGCHLCRTNYEEDWIQDTQINYQQLQNLVDFTDEEIETFTLREHERILSLTQDKNAMLRTLKADENSDISYKKALALYPELLREAYTRESIKAIKTRMIMDAKSGRIRCQNKRLYAIPDLYAACQFWFQHISEPEGLLRNGEIAANIYRRFNWADVLRSPALYMEHALRSINHEPHVYEWLSTNGVYTSCHDLISRILQFDCDGDQLNVVVDPTIVSVAERNLREFDVIPLFYDATKAGPEIINNDTMYHGLKRAHDYSNIGQISNALTKLWNKPDPDWDAAAWLCYFNNLMIDGAKTGSINSYEQYPEVHKRINAAIGGKRGRMPYFFLFTKNGRKTWHDVASKKVIYAKPNQSTMNRIAARFEDIGNINLKNAGVPPFNWQMLMFNKPYISMPDAVKLFCQLDDSNITNTIIAKYVDDRHDKENTFSYDLLKESIIHELDAVCGDYRLAYPSIVKHLFTGENLDKASHKQMFWRVYGDMAATALQQNLQAYHVCPACDQKIPNWIPKHVCIKTMRGFFQCVDCESIIERKGPRQCRCEACQEVYRRQRVCAHVSALRKRKKG